MNWIKLTANSLPVVWPAVLAAIGGRLSEQLKQAAVPDIAFPGLLTLRFEKRRHPQRAYCQEPSRVARIEKVIEEISGVRWSIRVSGVKGEPSDSGPIRPAPAYSDEGINNCFFKTESTILQDDLRFRSPAEIAIYED